MGRVEDKDNGVDTSREDKTHYKRGIAKLQK